MDFLPSEEKYPILRVVLQIGITIIGIYIFLAIVFMAFFYGLAALFRSKMEHFYMPAGFRLGSYDPARYPSDWLVRRP